MSVFAQTTKIKEGSFTYRKGRIKWQLRRAKYPTIYGVILFVNSDKRGWRQVWEAMYAGNNIRRSVIMHK